MRLLIDTHIAIWAVMHDPGLSPRATAMIADPENDVAISIASLWEIAIKNAVGRAPLPMTVVQAAAAFEAASFTRLPITIAHLAEIENLPNCHRDPFDRLLVATAIADTYRLVTTDHALRDYGDHVLLV